jgi:NAD(P)H-quinone oxidoreductase subunit 5
VSSFLLLPLIYAAVGFLQIIFAKQPKLYMKMSRLILWAGIVLYIYLLFITNNSAIIKIDFINYFGVKLNLIFIFDHLSRLMVFMILIVSGCIIRYSESYLASDQTQGRFLGQINLVIASVLMLILAGNLFTAFISWQLIGVSLYVLLNHYHYDLMANKAAKKKFIINRIGDLCFLIAIVLVYQQSSVSLFSHLSIFNHSIIIPSLIFVAVMTKSAQFPFHIWLPDTLETPTPVSALMHAGIINAGGILLIRCAPMLNQNTIILVVVMLVGFTTVVMGNIYMLRQINVKKQLAYSTMAQMGYMIFQCGTGLFSAALFHLIAHGFFKGYLFLSSGSALNIKQSVSNKTITGHNAMRAFALSALILFLAYGFFVYFSITTPLLFMGFVFITINQLLYGFITTQPSHLFVLMFSLFLAFLVATYLSCLHLLACYVVADAFWLTNISAQSLIFSVILLFQLLSFLKRDSKKIKTVCAKIINIFDVESSSRKLFLDPLRCLGESINRAFSQFASIKSKVLILLGFFIAALALFIVNNIIEIKTLSISIFIFCAIISMVVANRSKKISLVIFWLVIFQCSLCFILMLHSNKQPIALCIYYAVNMALILATLYSLLRNNKSGALKNHFEHYNVLSWPLLYLSIALLFLIGIPGTASFIGEFYFFKLLLLHSAGLLIAYAIAMLLLAIVSMHVLQLHVFRLNYSTSTHLKVTPLTHGLFILMLSTNLVSGLMPQAILHWVAQLL